VSALLHLYLVFLWSDIPATSALIAVNVDLLPAADCIRYHDGGPEGSGHHHDCVDALLLEDDVVPVPMRRVEITL